MCDISYFYLVIESDERIGNITLNKNNFFLVIYIYIDIFNFSLHSHNFKFVFKEYIGLYTFEKDFAFLDMAKNYKIIFLL